MMFIKPMTPYEAYCDICGKIKRRAFDFFDIPDKTKPIRICKSCADVLFPSEEDEEDPIEYFAATSPPVIKKKPEKPVVVPLDQISLFPGVL